MESVGRELLKLKTDWTVKDLSEAVGNVMQWNCTRVLQDRPYKESETGSLINDILEGSLEVIAYWNIPYKLVLECVLKGAGQSRVAGSSSFKWHQDTDFHETVHWESQNLSFLGTITGFKI